MHRKFRQNSSEPFKDLAIGKTCFALYSCTKNVFYNKFCNEANIKFVKGRNINLVEHRLS